MATCAMADANTVEIFARRVQLSFKDKKLRVLLVKSSLTDYTFPTGLGAQPVNGLICTNEMLYPLLPNKEIFVGQINRVPKLIVQDDKQSLAIDFYILLKPSTTINSAESGKWFNLEEAVKLGPSVAEVIGQTLQRLREDLNFQPIEYYLLPVQFTIPEFHSLYEIILAKKLNRRNFNRKMTSLDIMVCLGVKKIGNPSKAPTLYQFNKNYFKKIEEGLYRTY
jgi:8-oxo-dGTP diphosphatase